MYMRENVVFARDVDVERVPDGQAFTLPQGTLGVLTQALGTSFTVAAEGNLYRLKGEDADAIGRAAPASAAIEVEDPASLTLEDFEVLVWKTLSTCFDPEIPVDIVQLGLIYECEVTPGKDDLFDVRVLMTLTAAGCGMGDIIAGEARDKIEGLPRAGKVRVDLTFDPPWGRHRMSESALLALGL
ncbi:MAG: putative Fe-S cluster assembly protein SufT [Brachymonas sp.]|nr:putative Fe-S cluster assembly protein SufT [Brachymonas sp.]